jgi:hypothetical protein
MKKQILINLISLVSILTSNAQVFDTGDKVGIGIYSPNEKLEVNGFLKAGYVSIGSILSTESSKNYINLGSDNHGTLLLSSNLYLNGSNLYTANTHGTLSGAAIKIPGNGQIGQNNIEFWTTPLTSVSIGNMYSQTSPRMIINTVGNIGIGTTAPDEKLTVKGKIHTQEVRVDMAGPLVPDYVFASDYDLKPLSEVAQYIKENRHLPEIPSAKEIEANGLHLAEMNMKLLKKIEELTLYMMEQDKKITVQGEKLEKLTRNQAYKKRALRAKQTKK